MSEPPFKYRRLPGRGRRKQGLVFLAAAHSSLWLGPDHLLSVDRIWMNEEYKRFYFRDVQAITVQRTNSASARNWIFGTLGVGAAFLCGLFATYAGGTSARNGYLIAGGIITGFWLVLLLINLLRGPSCICRLRTAVQTEELPSLGHTGSARRAIAILKPLIEEVQGALAQGEIATSIAAPSPRSEPARPAPGNPAGPGGLSPAAQAPPGALAARFLHPSLYATLLLDGSAGFYTLRHPSWHLHLLVNSTLMLALTSLSVVALVRQRAMAVAAGLRALTTFTFAWNLAVLFVIFVYGFISRMAYTMAHPGALPPRINFYGMAGYKTFALVANISELGLGVAGFLLIIIHLARLGKESPRPANAGTPPDEPQSFA